MSVKSNGVQFSYTKALILVALVASSATSVITTRSPEDAIHGLQALNRQNAGHTEVSIKRYLRSNAKMTSSNPTGNPEERAGFTSSFTSSLSSLNARMKTSLSTVIEKLQRWWWSLWRKSPNYIFTRLGLGLTEAKLFESPAFFKWFAFLESRYPNSATEEMFKVLAGHYKDKAVLMKVLVAGTTLERTKEIADKLLEIQFKKWRENPRTSVNEILTFLKLAETGDELFESPVLGKWVALVKNIFKDEKITHEIVYVNLAAEYGDDEAFAKALAKGIAANNPLAEKLEAIRLSHQQTNDPKTTFTFLGDK
ncbi:unnamed protein product [Peronospora effusa]|nr:unnamed protein product [Peronospora effusa]